VSHFAEDCVLEMPRGRDPWGTRSVGKSAVREGLAGRFKGMPDVHYGDAVHRPRAAATTIAAAGERLDPARQWISKVPTPFQRRAKSIRSAICCRCGAMNLSDDSFVSSKAKVCSRSDSAIVVVLPSALALRRLAAGRKPWGVEVKEAHYRREFPGNGPAPDRAHRPAHTGISESRFRGGIRPSADLTSGIRLDQRPNIGVAVATDHFTT
jgi:hypothetical protein